MFVFREVQYFRQPLLVALLAGVLLLIGYGVFQQLAWGQPWGNRPMSDIGLAAFAAAFLLFVVWFWRLHLVTEVRESEVVLQFVGLWRPKRIPFAQIRRAEAVRYRPILDYGGWGIRCGFRGWAYNVSGNQGARIFLDDGKEFLVGSQRAAELAAAIQARLASPAAR